MSRSGGGGSSMTTTFRMRGSNWPRMTRSCSILDSNMGFPPGRLVDSDTNANANANGPSHAVGSRPNTANIQQTILTALTPTQRTPRLLSGLNSLLQPTVLLAVRLIFSELELSHSALSYSFDRHPIGAFYPPVLHSRPALIPHPVPLYKLHAALIQSSE